MVPRVLIIAGSDSGGGAGIQADIKTVTMLGGHAMTAITALTAQNTLGVERVMPVPTDMVLAQIDAVVRDIGVDAVKIGMIGSAETANAVAEYLAKAPPLEGSGWDGAVPPARAPVGQAPPPAPPLKGRGEVPIVFDPVMIATSGSTLADAATIDAFGRLMDVASVVTPNAPELEALGGIDAVLAHDCYLVVKGGHGTGPRVIDSLLSPTGQQLRELDGKRFDTDDTHGTGCTFASALATELARGRPIDEAFAEAVRFTRIALISAPGFGEGHGPIGHTLGHNPYAELEG
ncbi:MAG TPA: bifunctional hydroxymethylpyrimidine kinase/phosphomethylpyrimidine kinase [Sphingomonas sp.]|nr:bifunctional hydroxymethylpyrimidine kinase/phosphomethylpyrimidine kinase [Sphingomonas sp.]